MMPSRIFQTKRITVRPYTVQDFPSWNLSNAQDGKEKFRKRLQEIKRRAKADQIYIWGVFLNETGECVGEVDIVVINRAPFSWGNLGYQIHENYRGNGYAKEAAKLALKHAFETLQLHRLEIVMQANNKASKAVAESLGGHFEGVRKKFIPSPKGWKDGLVYSKVKK